ncbi:MAG: hypothetical protein HYY06_01660 [Deltaproteobacteria bacterium]|nr:hypothetical protein [Deltaproteobacteria bacterium]
MRERTIHELEERLADPDLDARGRNRILRRLKELARKPARRAHGADR